LNFSFDFNSWGAVRNAFSKTVHEIDVPISHGKLVIQVKGDSENHRFSLKFSSFAQKSFYALEKHEMLALAEALVTAAETGANPNQDQPL
jgi:hypothetical protein